ncbi:LysE family translocator [Pseudoalteromonas sp. OOF1S-7]|uniref:LysE family translocator n=1 Tax=Pseudoalteromonas sp. OOF1S-7 TaxID=2917757 RepID=UPI001EF44715|nr:LysE family translocator [Pseudoalteromonas sp. OOF1S-7]MCG7537211.1 LysE family translocator [Pseudoalteromonas sp. OOF1S-7]
MYEALFSIALTTALLLGSPGPAPLALAAVGASSGVRQGVPFLSGILLGLLVAIVAAATGLGALLLSYPSLSTVCQIVAIAYLFYVAYKIATNRSGLSHAEGSEVGFRDGFILNLLNPKAYAACIAIFANNSVPDVSPLIGAVLAAITCFIIAILVDSLWLIFGGVLHRFIKTPEQLRNLRLFFAFLLTSLLIWISTTQILH